jgi:hypothetical protein
MQGLATGEAESGGKNQATSKIMALLGAPEPPQSSYNLFGRDRHVMSTMPLVNDPEGDQEMNSSWEATKLSNSATDADLPLTVVHLLPDGRWQEIKLVRLELQFATQADSEAWARRLQDAQASATNSSRRRTPRRSKEDSSTTNSSPTFLPNWLNDLGATEDHSEAFAGDLSGRFVRPSAACKVMEHSAPIMV